MVSSPVNLDAVRKISYELEQLVCAPGGTTATALFAGQIIAGPWVAEVIRARSEVPSQAMAYGLGFWLDGDAAILEGNDPGVSFRSVDNPVTGTTHTVIANTSEGAWPLARYLNDTLPVEG